MSSDNKKALLILCLFMISGLIESVLTMVGI